MFEKCKASWIDELPSLIEKHNKTSHNSMKMTPNQAGKKSNEKKVYSSLHDRRVRQQPKFKLGHLVLTHNIKRVFRKGYSTNYSYNLYKITEFLHNTIPLVIELTI